MAFRYLVPFRYFADFDDKKLNWHSRSSHQRCSIKNVLRKFTKFTGKHLYQSLFFNKVADLRLATLLKRRIWHSCFPVNFAKFLKNTFFTEHLWTTASNIHRFVHHFIYSFTSSFLNLFIVSFITHSYVTLFTCLLNGTP